MTPLLAIIVPAYKSAFLREALESILRQTDGRFRIYVGDDASPEPVGEIIQSFGLGTDKLVYHRFAENLGGTSLVRQWERCIRLSNEPWVWLFSDDDVMEPGCVAAFFRELETGGDAFDLCRFNNRTLWMDGAKSWLVENPQHPANENGADFLLARLRDERTSTAQELIFSRSAWERSGGVPEFPLAWASDDAFIATLGVRRPIRVIAGPRIHWRVSEQNITRLKNARTNDLKLAASRMFVEWTQKFLAAHPPGTGPLTADEIARLTERWFFHQAYFSRSYLGLGKCLEVDRFAAAVWRHPRGYGFLRSLQLNCQLAGSRVLTICKRILGLPGKCVGSLVPDLPMKKQHIILVIAICTSIVIVALLLIQYRLPVAAVITNTTSNRLPPTNAQSNLVTTTAVGGKTNASGVENYSMKIMDSKTGQYAIVGLDRQTITLKDKIGNDIWTVNLAAEASKHGARPMEIELGWFNEKSPNLFVLAVNFSFELDLHTGEIIKVGPGRMANP